MEERRPLDAEELLQLTTDPPADSSGGHVPWTLEKRRISDQRLESRTTLADLTLTDSELHTVVWVSPIIRSSTLRNVAFESCTLKEARFKDVRFEGCSFKEVDAIDCVFADCEFIDCRIADCRDWRCRYQRNRSTNSTRSHWSIEDSTLTDCKFVGDRLDDLRLGGTRLIACQWTGGRIASLQATSGSWETVTFSELDLSGLAMETVRIEKLTCAKLAGASDLSFNRGERSHIVFEDCRSIQNLRIVGGKVSGLAILNCELDLPALFRCELTDFRVERSTLCNSCFEQATVNGVVTLTDCRLRGIAFNGGTWEGLTLRDVSVGENFALASVEFADLSLSAVTRVEPLAVVSRNVVYRNTPVTWEDCLAP